MMAVMDNFNIQVGGMQRTLSDIAAAASLEEADYYVVTFPSVQVQYAKACKV